MRPPREWTHAELVAEVLRMELIVRDARRHADDVVALAASAEWDRHDVDPLELRGRMARLQAGLDRVHDTRRREQAA